MFEERGRVLPAWFFRTVWPLMIPPVRWLHSVALRRHQRPESSEHRWTGTPDGGAQDPLDPN